MDADHATLGHTTAWTNALARRADHVSVITMLAGRIAVEPNVTVYSLGKELGCSEPRRLLTYYRLVHRVFTERPIDACFPHADRGLGLRLELVGGPATTRDHGYLSGLRRKASELGVEGLVGFRGPVPYGQVAGHYHAVHAYWTHSIGPEPIAGRSLPGCVTSSPRSTAWTG
jgi:hypothetical protein